MAGARDEFLTAIAFYELNAAGGWNGRGANPLLLDGARRKPACAYMGIENELIDEGLIEVLRVGENTWPRLTARGWMSLKGTPQPLQVAGHINPWDVDAIVSMAAGGAAGRRARVFATMMAFRDALEFNHPVVMLRTIQGGDDPEAAADAGLMTEARASFYRHLALLGGPAVNDDRDVTPLEAERATGGTWTVAATALAQDLKDWTAAQDRCIQRDPGLRGWTTTGAAGPTLGGSPKEMFLETRRRLSLSPAQRLEATPEGSKYLDVLRLVLDSDIRVGLVGGAGEAARGSAKPIHDLDLVVDTRTGDHVRLGATLYAMGFRLDLGGLEFGVPSTLLTTVPDAAHLDGMSCSRFVLTEPRRMQVDVLQECPIWRPSGAFWGRYEDLDPTAAVECDGRIVLVPTAEEALGVHTALIWQQPLKEHRHRAAMGFLEMLRTVNAMYRPTPLERASPNQVSKGSPGAPASIPRTLA